VGAAFQRGALPVSAASVEEAIRLNGAAVDKNLAAFAWGRACIAAPDAVAALEPAPAAPPAPAAADRELVATVGTDPGSELEALLLRRVAELVAYQDRRLAARYAATVRDVLAAERAAADPRAGTPVAEAVATNLFKLLAYKDEYEVARLHLDSVERAKLEGEFGPDAKVFFRLHPPVLRALGMQRKLKLGAWFLPAFRLLRALKWLRGTPADPFGRAEVRRVERALPGEYEAMVRAALEQLTPATHAAVAELAGLADLVRGYEDIKLAGVARFRERATEVRARIAAGGDGGPAKSRQPYELPFTTVG
jgi:indolepyruvate ferredoxin oxidoreductase